MTPFQKKMKSLTHRKYLPVRLDNLPPRIEKDILDDLVTRLRNGDKTVINTIIEGHLRLGMYIAARYGSIYPDKVEDLIGVMQLALVIHVRKAKRKLRDNNITPYLTTNIHSDILEFIEKDHTIRVPGRTVRYMATKGDARLERLPSQIIMKEDVERESTGEDNIPNIQLGTIPQTINTDIDLIETRELLEKATNNYIEKRVIELRAEGFSYEEIGPQVGFAKSKIQLIVSSIEKRFDKFYAS